MDDSNCNTWCHYIHHAYGCSRKKAGLRCCAKQEKTQETRRTLRREGGTIVSTAAGIRVRQASHVSLIPGIENTTRTCSICADDKYFVEYPSETALPSSCSAHCRNICLPCLGESLSAEISNKPLSRIGRPVCDQAWDRGFVEVHAKAGSVQAYYTREALALLEALPEFRFCQSPTCHSGQLHASGAAEPIVTCTDCGFQSCFVHRMPWHNGRTCAEFDTPETKEERRDRLAREKAAFEKKNGKGAKPCPRCRAPIFRDGGCNEMICRFSLPVLLDFFITDLIC